MLVDLQCLKCKEIVEEYFYSLEKMLEAIEGHSVACLYCGGNEMRRLFSGCYIGMGEVPGYEKKNKDHPTLGFFCDQYKSKWV